MKFENSFFEDEVRDGFYVSSLMKRSWAAHLEVLDGMQKVCAKHNIQYFAEWGTLLGAIRHGGMIPWDDDFDICMTSEEYNKFRAVADELPNGFFLVDYRDSETTDNMVARIQNANRLVVPKDVMERCHGFPYIAGIDIFRLDSLPEDASKRKEYHNTLLIVAGVIGLINGENEEEGEADQKTIDEYLLKLEKLCGVKFDHSRPIKTQLYSLLMEYLPSVYGERDARELTNIPRWSDYENYRLPKKCYATSLTVPFENTEIQVPVGYEELLRRKYGRGYMKPQHDCDTHSYPYYEKYHKYLEKNTYLQYFEYQFSLEDYEFSQKEREQERERKGETLQEKVKSFLPLFQEAHNSIKMFMENGEWENLIELLGECQNVAIQIGTMIEEECGEGHTTVVVLERYCEFLFRIHQGIVESVEQQMDIEKIVKELTSFERELAEHVESDLKKKKEIVFVPYKASHWSAMESVWKAAMEDKDTDVYVIPAPYYYKDSMGRLMKEEPQYEVEGYPDQVTITSYEKYNFQFHHPDIIVIQCPYDEFNYAMSIHPFFYARNLMQYTEQLIYIPPLVMDDVEVNDDRAKAMLKSFCNMPGVVYADTVFVQSEKMKEVYVDLLTEFAGEDTRKIWENKILGMGSPVYDSEREINREEIEIPEGWNSVLRKENGEWKKIILYSTSASALLWRGEQIIAAMQNVFDAFRNTQEEVALIWRPDRNVRNILRHENSVLWQKYRDLVQKYKSENVGIYDDSPERDRAVLLCDVAYGDGGDILNECRNHKKPVMIQHVI